MSTYLSEGRKLCPHCSGYMTTFSRSLYQKKATFPALTLTQLYDVVMFGWMMKWCPHALCSLISWDLLRKLTLYKTNVPKLHIWISSCKWYVKSSAVWLRKHFTRENPSFPSNFSWAIVFFYGSPRFISFFYLNIMVKYNAEYIYLVAVSDFDVFYIFFFTQPLNLQVHKGYIVFSVCLGSYFFL